MHPAFALLGSLVTAIQAQVPQFHMVPPSAAAGFQERTRLVLSVTGTGDLECLQQARPEDIVVCGRSGSDRFRAGPIDPDLARRYTPSPDGPSAGVQIRADAMEESRCAVVRCAPRPLIGIFGRRF